MIIREDSYEKQIVNIDGVPVTAETFEMFNILTYNHSDLQFCRNVREIERAAALGRPKPEFQQSQSTGGNNRTRSLKVIEKPSVDQRCWHEGAIIDGGHCKSCGGNAERANLRHRRMCHAPNIMSPCHREFIPESRYRSCDECDFFDPVEISPNISVEQMMEYIQRSPAPPHGWPDNWNNWENTKQAHWNLADECLRNMPAYPEGKYSGRGVTIAAGGRYWASAYVTARMVRHWCNLPIKIYFLGESGERDDRYIRLLEQIDGIECLDIDTQTDRNNRRMVKGFGTKFFAAMASPFEEVLSLDPDNYPCSDPSILFDDPRYKQTGGIYWPDVHYSEKWTQWKFWNIEPFGKKAGLETGQYVLNKRQAWEQLNLTNFYEDHADWCYGRAHTNEHGDYGDKGPPRAAWAKMRREYTMFVERSRYEKFAYLQPGPDGKTPMFIHRCHSKWMAEGPLSFSTTPQSGENLRGGFPGEEIAFGFLEEIKLALRSHRL